MNYTTLNGEITSNLKIWILLIISILLSSVALSWAKEAKSEPLEINSSLDLSTPEKTLRLMADYLSEEDYKGIFNITYFSQAIQDEYMALLSIFDTTERHQWKNSTFEEAYFYMIKAPWEEEAEKSGEDGEDLSPSSRYTIESVDNIHYFDAEGEANRALIHYTIAEYREFESDSTTNEKSALVEGVEGVEDAEGVEDIEDLGDLDDGNNSTIESSDQTLQLIKSEKEKLFFIKRGNEWKLDEARNIHIDE